MGLAHFEKFEKNSEAQFEGVRSDDGRHFNPNEKWPGTSAYLIKKCVRQYKAHRSMDDIDKGWIAAIVRSMKGAFLSE